MVGGLDERSSSDALHNLAPPVLREKSVKIARKSATFSGVAWRAAEQGAPLNTYL
jgi:hypothetical protein